MSVQPTQSGIGPVFLNHTRSILINQVKRSHAARSIRGDIVETSIPK